MIEIIQGDITTLAVDAVVNAANNSLLGGGGVDGAIHRRGGPAILEDCQRIRARQGGCPTGEAVITTAGKLPARYVIHTVGPVWSGGDRGEDELLRSCYRNALDLAEAHQLSSIAFPNISTGIYGFPKERAARMAFQAVTDYLVEAETSLTRIVFVCFDVDNYRLYRDLQEGA